MMKYRTSKFCGSLFDIRYLLFYYNSLKLRHILWFTQREFHAIALPYYPSREE